MKLLSSWFFLALLLAFTGVSFANESLEVMKTFTDAPSEHLISSFDEQREQHKILFYMGIILLLLIFTTAGFGLAMALKGAKVFLPHMIFAGLTVFLSIAHAVAAVVWFFPFR